MKLSPLTDLIIDLKVKHMTKDQIRKKYLNGGYAGALEKHVVGYVKDHFGA